MVNFGYTESGFGNEVYHIHLRRKGNIKEVKFKEYMLSHPNDLKRYEKLKIELASKYKHDRDGYTEAKTPFIKQIEKKM